MPKPMSSELVVASTTTTSVVPISSDAPAVEQRVGPHRLAHEGDPRERLGPVAPGPLHVAPGGAAEHPRGAIGGSRKQPGRRARARCVNRMSRTLSGKLREVVEE